MADRKIVSGMLDKLIELDATSNKAYYEMGQILYAFSTQKLYEIAGYDTLSEMIEEELSFTVSTAHHYSRFYGETKRLHYTKKESLKLLKEHGLTKLSKVLIKSKDKIGTIAIKKRINKFDEFQISFTLTEDELKDAHRALLVMGATQTGAGRYQHSSEAFMSMVHQIVKVKKAA